MLWGALPLDGVGSCWLFFTDDLHDILSWVPASNRPHTFKSCFTHSSQVFYGRPGPFLPGTGLDLALFISPLERMTCPNHQSRCSQTRMARSHIPSLASRLSIDGSSNGLTPQIQRIIVRSLRHNLWRVAEVMGQVSIPCNIKLSTLELNRRNHQVERHRLGRKQRKVFTKLTPGTPASSSGSSHTATTSSEHAETINRFEHTVTNLNLLERAAVDRAYTRLTMAMRAFIGHVLGECFEAWAFLIINPQVAFGVPDGWPTYSRKAHSIWELAGILQDIQPEPRSHELCFSHVYMKTLGFQSRLPRLDTLNTFLERSSNDHEIICKEQLPGHPHPKISR